MSLKTFAAVAALAFVLTPAAAQAQAQPDPLLSTFQSACVAADGDANATMAKLDGQGWDVLPAELLGADAPFDNMQARIKFEGAGMVIAMTGDMADEMGTLTDSGNVHLAVCAVGTTPGDYEAVDRVVADWLGMTPNTTMSMDGLRGYPYTLVNGRRQAVPADLGEGELMALVDSGQVRVVMTGDSDGVIMIMFMRPVPN
ncbi:hypothetical protein [Brevundimonas sp. A19_0]|uniref:hypothetical protein n=1 Tax=Brevundimonas sp. A19_0 TaxID=2821087 RepID=UPI001ADCBEE9|nr:hypothetical protein [Brevundimonas sp. A19_0]MBO9501914.1 hypothetical protein [Brevundimonas sp. A19_0]